ncbi:MAG: hypothetical protein CL845_07865 [Crocinitomicaceae bacterium]|nr:hypothetical protein [Crocinitomicaceae bacterium]|tara:strand:+ start:597 stop:974 length:378 start_codon:yes stop_codon:yes gene_type:complete
MMVSLIELLCFSIAGLIGVVANYSITFVFREFSALSQFKANSLGLSSGLFVNFLINKYVTFACPEIDAIEIILYFIISMATLIFNHYIVKLFVNRIGLNFYFAKVLATSILFFWNFIMHSHFTFA